MTGAKNNVGVTSARVAGLVALMGQQAKVLDVLRGLQIAAVSVDPGYARVVLQPMVDHAENILGKIGEALGVAEEWLRQAREQETYLASLDAEGLRVFVAEVRA